MVSKNATILHEKLLYSRRGISTTPTLAWGPSESQWNAFHWLKNVGCIIKFRAMTISLFSNSALEPKCPIVSWLNIRSQSLINYLLLVIVSYYIGNAPSYDSKYTTTHNNTRRRAMTFTTDYEVFCLDVVLVGDAVRSGSFLGRVRSNKWSTGLSCTDHSTVAVICLNFTFRLLHRVTARGHYCTVTVTSPRRWSHRCCGSPGSSNESSGRQQHRCLWTALSSSHRRCRHRDDVVFEWVGSRGHKVLPVDVVHRYCRLVMDSRHQCPISLWRQFRFNSSSDDWGLVLDHRRCTWSGLLGGFSWSTVLSSSTSCWRSPLFNPCVFSCALVLPSNPT